MSEKVQFIFVTHNKISMEKSTHLLGRNNERSRGIKSCVSGCRASNGASTILNPLYQYIIYAILALVIVGIISFKLYKIYQERGEIKLSKELGKILSFLIQESK